MVVLHTSNIDIAYFKKRIEQKMKHTYLHEYIEKPTIDEEKLFILISIMERANLSPKQKEQYIVTTMLVQLALDTHDLVPVNSTSLSQANSELSKQLTVLAGDYYSGLYYLLLSQIEDFSMIRTLATAIKEINEYKMTLYYQEITTTEEFMFSIKKIESLLFSYVADHIGLPPLDESIGEWLLINTLFLENNRVRKNRTSPLINVWKKLCNQHQELYFQNSLEEMIDARTNLLKATVTTQTLQQDLSLIKELLYKYTTLDVEEG